jgi:hypothetical protein
VPAEVQLVPAETDLVPAEADQGSAEEQLVPAEADPVPAQMQLEATEAPQVSAEAPQVSPEAPPTSAEVPPVSAEAPQVSAEAQLVPAEADLVSAGARPADTASKRTPSVVTEDPDPVLPSEREAGATAVCAEATSSMEPCRHACCCWRGAEGAAGCCAKSTQEEVQRSCPDVGETSFPAGTRGSSSQDCRQQRDSTW